MTSTTTAATSARLHLRLLGAPRLVLADGTSCVLERHTAALLALLALNGPTPRAKAAALVWPEVDDQHAGNSLRQRIYKLRQLAGREVIVTDKLIALAEEVTHDLHAPLARLTEDPESCQGELLGEQDFADSTDLDEWVTVARQRWRGELAHALAELASRLENEGRIAAALRMSERLLDLDPILEHAHRRVMRLHYMRGDGAAALAAFDRCRLVLKSELGVLPDKETQELQRLIESSEVPVARVKPPSSLAVLRPPRLIGRDTEWRRIEQTWHRGRTTLIVGEAGIGKSRVLTDFAAAHEGIVSRARPGDGNVPYATMARLLRTAFECIRVPSEGDTVRELARILPELGTPASGQLEPLRLRRAIELCLNDAASAGVALIALDDLQFADAASLELLPTLAQCPRHTAPAAGWLLACRLVEVPAALRAWMNAQDSDALSELRLGPLDLGAVTHLLESLALANFDAARWAPALWRHTGGNPMFILETLRSLLANGATPAFDTGARLPLPADVGGLVERRLQQLTPDALNLARVAALAGQDFTPELAAKVLERRVIDLAEPWLELEAAQVIRAGAFAHDLILEATQRSVPQAIGRTLHGAIAQTLQASHGESARIAAHWQEAEAFDPACSAYLAAADAARTVSRLDEELHLLVRADSCLQRGALPARRPAVLLRALVAAFELGRIDEMKVFATALDQAAITAADQLLAFEGRMRVQAQDGRLDAMLSTFEQALPLALSVGTELQQMFLRGLQANALARSSRSGEAIEALEVCIAWARHNPDHPWVSGILVENAQTLGYLERYRQSAAVAEQAYHAAERVSHVRHMHMASANLAMLSYVCGDVENSAIQYERCRALADRFGGDSLQSWSQGAGLARSLRLLGRYDQALMHAQSQADACTRGDPNGSDWWRVVAELENAHCHFELGQIARARTALGARRPDHPDAQFRWLLLRYRFDGGRSPQARAWLDEAVALSEGGLRPAGKQWTVAPELCLVLPVNDAATLIQRHADSCRSAGALVYLWPMLARWVQALMQAGRVDEANAAAQQLLDECQDRQPYGMYRPELWWILFSAFEAGGDLPAAHAALQAAVTWIEREALPHVPDAFRHSFLSRNPINRTLLAAAQRLI